MLGPVRPRSHYGKFEAGSSVKTQHVTQSRGHTVFFCSSRLPRPDAFVNVTKSPGKLNADMDSHGSRPFVYYTKNCRIKFSNFSLIFHYYKKMKGPCVHGCCCFFSNYLKPFSVVVSWIRQEKSASQLCFS